MLLINVFGEAYLNKTDAAIGKSLKIYMKHGKVKRSEDEA